MLGALLRPAGPVLGGLPAAGLVLIIRMILLVLDTETFGLVHERALLRLVQQPSGQQMNYSVITLFIQQRALLYLAFLVFFCSFGRNKKTLINN